MSYKKENETLKKMLKHILEAHCFDCGMNRHNGYCKGCIFFSYKKYIEGEDDGNE